MKMKAEVEVEGVIQDSAPFAYLPSVLIPMTPTKIKGNLILVYSSP